MLQFCICEYNPILTFLELSLTEHNGTYFWVNTHKLTLQVPLKLMKHIRLQSYAHFPVRNLHLI